MNKTRGKPEFRLLDIPQDLLSRGRQMVGMGRDVWLAGLGAVATVEEEGSSLFTTLVKRGEKLEAEGRKRIGAVKDDLNVRQKSVTHTLDEKVYEPMLRAMSRFGVPTRGEIRDLSAKVDALTKHVDLLVTRLAQERAATGSAYAIYYVVSRDDGWAIGREGMDMPLRVYPTKEDALEEARTLSNKNAPAKLHVYKKDGTIQDTFTYDG
jgi:poly(hydroxyalkanoate) granule-associated protein